MAIGAQATNKTVLFGSNETRPSISFASECTWMNVTNFGYSCKSTLAVGCIPHEDGVAFHKIRFVVSSDLLVESMYDGDTPAEGEVSVGMVAIRTLAL